jgi:hypothetical protein
MQSKTGTFKFCDDCSNLCYIHPSFTTSSTVTSCSALWRTSAT